jgi:hypothetical protein
MEMGWKRGNRRGGLGQKNAEMILTESGRKSKEDVATFLAELRASRRIHVRLVPSRSGVQNAFLKAHGRQA